MQCGHVGGRLCKKEALVRREDFEDRLKRTSIYLGAVEQFDFDFD